MRIAMLSPISWRTPPRHYGPWELVTSMLTEGLVERGLDVTLFATKDSITRARLVGVAPRGYSEDPNLDPKVWECLHISEVFERAQQFDLIHNQFDFLPLTYSGLVKTPVVTTIHGFSSPKILAVYEKYNPTCAYVSISDADRSPTLDYIATIHHGIDLNDFTFFPQAGDYLLFFGRIHPDKGVEEAIQFALAVGEPLILAGIIQDQRYFDEKVAPHLDGGLVKFLGPVVREQRSEMLGRAKAVLHFINFDEPFGMTVVESMACGTPVIAVARGSMPEVILQGKTGLLVQNWQEAVERFAEIDRIDRAACRKWVENSFSLETMVSKYIDVYEKIVKTKG